MPKKFGLEYENIPLLANVNRTAQNTDTELINPWGSVVVDNTIWIANNGSGVISNYTIDGRKLGNSVIVNWGTTARGRPTGIVSYAGTGFNISNGLTTAPAKLITVTQDGAINAYNPMISTTNAVQVVDEPNKIFFGVEIAQENLYVTDFKNALIEKYNSNFQLVAQFTDIDLVNAGYSPFNVYESCCKLYVTFAKANNPCPYLGTGGSIDVPGIGNGYIDVFDLNGTLLERFTSRGPLNSPWGMAELRVCKNEHLYRYLLVGNNGDGAINIYNLKTKKWVGSIQNENGDKIVIDKLWSIIINCESDILYTSGADNKLLGIYGVLKNVN
ncbi:hypothetical protein Catovirus_1_356 [Catovirus CTV1]|uniref:TIGR03118 family protein n=1 Tax=Catovirus CTV1 TaxID=1977631 RepID=A0A1V0S9B1_9VIRU|nr:hypothetical protein Catovirus_1_356 [Catovirus CTV1]